MKVGFTGTRYGMTEAQKLTVTALLQELKPEEVRHGDCIGADADFAEISYKLEPRPEIIAHPGRSAFHQEKEMRANSQYNTRVLPTKTHFARNRDIVDESEVLIAAPYDPTPQPKGGTWYTINFADKMKKKVYVVWPDGTIRE